MSSYEKFRLYKNYAIIALVSLIALLVFPFFGSVAGLAIALPNTVAGWLVFIASKVVIAAVNFVIFYCFVDQGKFNVRNDPRYLDAHNKLNSALPLYKVRPISPTQHYRHVYGVKGITLLITSLLGTFSLTQAILSFDVITLITYIIVIVFGVIFGVIQMGAEEVFWTEDYPYYVSCLIEEQSEPQITKQDKGEINNVQQQQHKETIS